MGYISKVLVSPQRKRKLHIIVVAEQYFMCVCPYLTGTLRCRTKNIYSIYLYINKNMPSRIVVGLEDARGFGGDSRVKSICMRTLSGVKVLYKCYRHLRWNVVTEVDIYIPLKMWASSLLEHGVQVNFCYKFASSSVKQNVGKLMALMM